jgi:hypothetical protein
MPKSSGTTGLTDFQTGLIGFGASQIIFCKADILDSPPPFMYLLFFLWIRFDVAESDLFNLGQQNQ